MADLYSLPDFDEDDAPDVDAHLADPSATDAEGDADDDVEAHGQSSFR
jgi:hypothetical protein